MLRSLVRLASPLSVSAEPCRQGVIRAALLACLAVFCLVRTTSAQVNTADILGTVNDAGGAVVVNAKVTIQNTATNDIKTTTTNAAGDYVFNLVQPGQYTITVEMVSFKKATVSLAVSAGDRAR